LHFRKIKDLPNDFSDICVVVQGVFVRLFEGIEDSIRVVVVHALKLNQGVDERTDSGQVMEHNGRVGVMRSTVKAIINIYESIGIFVLSFEVCLSFGGAK